MDNNNSKFYLEFANLVRSQISGPFKRELVRKSQMRFVKRLKKAGVVNSSEAKALML